MATIGAIGIVDPLKKQDPNQVQAQGQKEQGLTFLKNGKEGKAQNTAVFNGLDNPVKQAIQQAIGDKAWVNPKKVADAINTAGGQAVLGKEGGKDYIEITSQDGQKSRIWDIGSDGGIGTQDIDFNGALGDFKKEVNNTKAANAAAPAANTVAADNQVAAQVILQNDVTATNPAENPLDAKKADKEANAIYDTNPKLKDKEKRNELRSKLEGMGYKDPEIEPLIDKLIVIDNLI